MEQSNKLTHCPICESETLENVFDVKDHMITLENFTIQSCQNCGFWFTNPRPTEDKIGSYYKSEKYISHSSTHHGLINKIYNVIRNYTLKQKRKLISDLTTERRLLDIGAGTGHFLNECQNNGWRVTGLEPDEQPRSFAKEHFDIELQTIDNLYRLPSSSFDVIAMWHVLEHVYHLKKDLSQIYQLLSDDGFLVIAVPNHLSYDAVYYKNNWAALDVPRHLSHFSESNIVSLMQQIGLRHVATKPMKFDSFYISMLSEKYIKGSLLKAFYIGLKSNLKAKSGNGYSSQIYIFQKNAL